MKNRILSIFMAAAMLLSLTACGNGATMSDSQLQDSQSVSDSASSETEDSSDISAAEETEEYIGNNYDLNELYQALLDKQPQDLPPLELKNESENTELIKQNYPNFFNPKYRQMLYYVGEMDGLPCEIMLVQTTNDREADYIEEEFLIRIENAAFDGNSDLSVSETWASNAMTYRDERFVAMICLPDGYEISYIFGLI